MSSPRVSNTCTECSRRKIRCNKQFPCDNCEKRGRVDLCERPNIITLEIPRPLSSSTFDGRANAYKTAENVIAKLLEPFIERLDRLESLSTSTSNVLPARESYNVTEASFTTNQRAADYDKSPTSHYQGHPTPEGLSRADCETNIPLQPAHGARIEHIEPQDTVPRDDTNNQYEANQDAGAEDAATILEYLARGRLTTHISETIELNKTAPLSSFEKTSLIDSPSSWERFRGALGDRYSSIEALRLKYLQELLPVREKVWIIVEYHRSKMLWIHNSFHGSSFTSELKQFYIRDKGQISSSSLGLQWASLLFAILSSTMACAKVGYISRWGFRESDQEPLARLWYDAANECQSAARCYDSHTIYTPQAIGTMTWSAHSLGNGDNQSILEAIAIRMMQSLGLHRARRGRRGNNKEPGSDLDDKIQQETSRRLWQQLTQQDWFSVPFSENYCISPLHFSSDPPLNCDDETMEPLPQSTPTITTYTNFIQDIAILIPRLQDKLSESQTEIDKYKVVMEYDRKMRDIVLQRLPPALSSQIPIHPTWPSWIALARHSATITLSNKIIMIHRHFIWRSFTDPLFAFTRATCLAAARTTLNEFIFTQVENMPNFWHLENFSIAAGIILSLDNFNRSQVTSEYVHHRRLLGQTLELLSRNVKISTIARRGFRLLSELRMEEEHIRANHTKGLQSPTGHKRDHDGNSKSSTQENKRHLFKVSEFVKKFLESERLGNDKPQPMYLSPQSVNGPMLSHLPPDGSPAAFNTTENLLNNDSEYSNHLHAYNVANSDSHMYSSDSFQVPHGEVLTEPFESQETEWFEDLLGYASVPYL